MNFFERYKGKIPVEDLNGLLTVKPSKTIRVNSLLISRDELMNRLTKKGFSVVKHPIHEQAVIILKEPFSIGASTEYLAGYFIVQDPASMIAVSELGLKSGELVLDLTAAPGAKTTHISELIGDGVVVAVDNNKSRLKSVFFNAERMGCGNIICLNIDAKSIASAGLVFDKVLLDAPCSAEGTLHKNPEVLKRQAKYKQIVSEQLALIESAIKVLKKGGTLVYSTCAVNPAENEGVVRHAINQGMRLVKPLTAFGKSGIGLKMTRRFYPHTTDSQGFFIARMVKN